MDQQISPQASVFADVTGDGYAVAISTVERTHPVYKTNCHEIRARLPLTAQEARIYAELTTDKTGIARLHIRSALAQLGVDAFHPSCTQVELAEDILHIDSLITSFNGEVGERVIACMRSLIEQGAHPRILHAGLLPHRARVSSQSEVVALLETKSIDISGAQLYEDGSVGLIPSNPLYEFLPEVTSQATLRRILLGDGRATLQSMWAPHKELPATIASKEFFVTGVDVHTRDHHIVLRRDVLTGETHAEVVHGESCILQAGRTRGGSRQLELWNTNGTPQKMADLRVVADIYRARKSEAAGL